MVIEIKDKGKTVAVITAVKISQENGLAEYQIDKQIYVMGKMSAVKKYGTVKVMTESQDIKLAGAIINFVIEGE